MSAINLDVEELLSVHMYFILEMRRITVGVSGMEEFGELLIAIAMLATQQVFDLDDLLPVVEWFNKIHNYLVNLNFV